MTPDATQEFLDAQLTAVFEAFANGLDVSPADLFRLEGAMGAAVTSGTVKPEWLRGRLVALAESHLGQDMAERYRKDDQWHLYMQMQRAPVYPSTRS